MRTHSNITPTHTDLERVKNQLIDKQQKAYSRSLKYMHDLVDNRETAYKKILYITLGVQLLVDVILLYKLF